LNGLYHGYALVALLRTVVEYLRTAGYCCAARAERGGFDLLSVWKVPRIEVCVVSIPVE
jgi:hypothetical protein